MLANQRKVYLFKLVLVFKRQPGVQMELSSSDLPEEDQNLVKENSVTKIRCHVKTKNVPANYVVEMYDIEKDNTHVFTLVILVTVQNEKQYISLSHIFFLNKKRLI